MKILGRLALLFVVLPILELMLLIEMGRYIGSLPTLGIVVLTGFTGAWLARTEGLRVFFRFQEELVSGRLPGQAMLDGVCVLVGGAFLLTPGVITDFLGFSLLLPFTRRWIQSRMRDSLERQVAAGRVHVASSYGEGFDTRRGGLEQEIEAREAKMDPSKGIVIEPEGYNCS
jgi:UPF0716 protein FxsA